MLFHQAWLVLLSSLWISCSFFACQNTLTVENVTSSTPEPSNQDRTPGSNVISLEEAEKEQGYYLQQLFHLYGENNTLSYQGLTTLLKSLGLGKVQVVQIQHADMGHDHVSHLDILDVQENKHKHVHSGSEHLTVSSTPQKEANDLSKGGNTSIDTTPKTQLTAKAESDEGKSTVPDKKMEEVIPFQRHWPARDLLQKVLRMHQSEKTHQHEDCLNATQLLVNFGLQLVSEITPEHFTLLCPALLYQIESRVCIKHNDQLTYQVPKSQQSLLKVLGWSALAVTVISVPSLLAVALVPLLRRPLFRYLLRFLVALAMGTLCGDALLHLLPHSQEDHTAPTHENGAHPVKPVLKGLCVLGGIYLLFLIESIMGLVKQKRQQKKLYCRQKPAQDDGCTMELWDLGQRDGFEICEASGAEADWQHVHERPVEKAEGHHSHKTPHPPHGHSGHSHNVGSGGIAEFVWMVLLGDGIHNFTDGLAIGAAFSAGFSGGLSTTVAVFCHELPHELGDFAVLLQTGVSVRRVLCFSLMSAFLSYLGMLVGAVASQSSAHISPWIFAVTAGVFLYVALVDMLPQMLHRESADVSQAVDCVLHSAGFLFGCGIMLCIALFQDQMLFLDL